MFDDFQDMEEEQGGFDGFAASYEPEEPEGLAAPRHSSLCLGHEQSEKILLDLINSGNMPHAVIFNGPVGIGKSTMAFRLARYLLKHGTADANQDSLFGDMPAAATSLDVPANDPVFAKVASGGHPDLLYLEHSLDPKKANKQSDIDVYTARKVAPFLRMTSSNGGWRVVIVDNADTMNRNAQNALLKILEEPPNNALLVLITHRLGAMIPTIRSRCRTLNFNPLSEDVLAQLMEREVGATLAEQDKKLLATMAGGSIGRAQKIINSGGLETAQNVLTILEGWPNFNWLDIHHLSELAGRNGQEENFSNIEQAFMLLTEEIVFSKARGEGALPPPLNSDAFHAMMAAHPPDKWLEIHAALKAHFAQADYANLDKRQAVLHAFNLIKD